MNIKYFNIPVLFSIDGNEKLKDLGLETDEEVILTPCRIRLDNVQMYYDNPNMTRKHPHLFKQNALNVEFTGGAFACIDMKLEDFQELLVESGIEQSPMCIDNLLTN